MTGLSFNLFPCPTSSSAENFCIRALRDQTASYIPSDLICKMRIMRPNRERLFGGYIHLYVNVDLHSKEHSKV